MSDNKEMTFQRITAYVLVTVLFAFAGSVAGIMTLKAVDKLYPNHNNAWVNFILKEAGVWGFSDVNSPHGTIQIDWAERYPFETEDVVQPVSQHPFYISLWSAAVASAEEIKDKLSIYTQDYLLFRETYVEAATTLETILGLSFMQNAASTSSYAVLDDGYLVNYEEPVDAAACANSLAEFNQFLKSRNIPLLYIQAPDKVCEEDAIASTRNFANRNADDLLTILKQGGVSTLDLREEIRRQGLVHHDLFLKTDHHWKPETGLWAAKVTADRLNASFGFDIDTSLYNPANYNYQIEDDYLGSIGRRATLAVANPEPITFIFPKFKTDLVIRIPSRNLDERGDFSVVYYKELWAYMSQAKHLYNKSYYSVYSYADNALTFLRNNRVICKKILMIGDSFKNVAAPFLALGVESMDALDLRHFTGSVRSFVDQTSPDIVLVFYHPGVISNAIDYDSHSSLFDFR